MHGLYNIKKCWKFVIASFPIQDVTESVNMSTVSFIPLFVRLCTV